MQQMSGVLLHLLLHQTTAGTEEGKGRVQEWAMPASLFIPCPLENSPAGSPYSQALRSPLHSLVPPPQFTVFCGGPSPISQLNSDEKSSSFGNITVSQL